MRFSVDEFGCSKDALSVQRYVKPLVTPCVQPNVRTNKQDKRRDPPAGLDHLFWFSAKLLSNLSHYAPSRLISRRENDENEN